MTSFTVRHPEIGRCICGTVLHVDSFRDDRAYRAFYSSGLCQNCSDRAFLCMSAAEPGRRLPLRRGALVAHRVVEDAGGELCLLPFLFVAEEGRVAWEARYIVRIGPHLDPFDPFDELLPMKDQLKGHQIRVHEGSSLEGVPGPAEHMAGLELLIGADRAALEAAVATGVFPSAVRCVSLADGLPRCGSHGRPVLPLERWWPYSEGPPSTLRVCALLGFVLCLPGRRGEEHWRLRRLLRQCGGGSRETEPVRAADAQVRP